ncbi:hypothetical protein KI387_034916, partial [Taxus chinensis]
MGVDFGFEGVDRWQKGYEERKRKADAVANLQNSEQTYKIDAKDDETMEVGRLGLEELKRQLKDKVKLKSWEQTIDFLDESKILSDFTGNGIFLSSNGTFCDRFLLPFASLHTPG